MHVLQVYLTRTLFFQEITPFGTHPKMAFVNVQIIICPQLLQDLWLVFDYCDAERQLLLLQGDKWRKSVRWVGGQKWDFSYSLLPVSNEQPCGWLFPDSKQVFILINNLITHVNLTLTSCCHVRAGDSFIYLNIQTFSFGCFSVILRIHLKYL